MYLDYRKYNQGACVNEKFVKIVLMKKLVEKSFLIY